jgi:signal transduction histidine kinase
MRTAISPVIQDDAHLNEFIDYLHAAREDQRVALARRIHDELGGLLVAAAMDLGWAESHLSSADMVGRLRRIGVSLAGAIDMKRDIIEQLRPSLLDNFGLFEALRWFFKHACQRSNVICTDTYPPEEIPLPPRALSQVFRATESLLDCTFREEHLRSVTLEAAIGAAHLSITVGHEHLGPESVDVLQCFRHELKSTAHRLNTLRGQLSFDRHGTGLNFYVEIPLAALA